MVPQRVASTGVAPASAALQDARRPRPTRGGGRLDPRTPETPVNRLVFWASVAAIVALLLVTSTSTAVAADATVGAAAAPVVAQQTVPAPVAAVAPADRDDDGLDDSRDIKVETDPRQVVTGGGTNDVQEGQTGTNPRHGDDESAGDAAEALLERTPTPLLVLGVVLLVVAARAGWKFYRWYRSPVVVKISEQ